jgi:hypothetical protein
MEEDQYTEVSVAARRHEIADFQSEFRQSRLTPPDRHLRSDKAETGATVETIWWQMWKKCVAELILENERLYAMREASNHPETASRELVRRAGDQNGSGSLQRLLSIFKENDVRFWTFNYDRLLEILFLHCVQSNFHLQLPEAFARLKGLPIHHIHGTVGGFCA